MRALSQRPTSLSWGEGIKRGLGGGIKQLKRGPRVEGANDLRSPHPATLIFPSRWSLSNLTSASTISLTRSTNLVLGSQPNRRLALLESPINRSTSAGR